MRLHWYNIDNNDFGNHFLYGDTHFPRIMQLNKSRIKLR